MITLEADKAHDITGNGFTLHMSEKWQISQQKCLEVICDIGSRWSSMESLVPTYFGYSLITIPKFVLSILSKVKRYM